MWVVTKSNCSGYYSGNELAFLPDARDRCLELPADDYGHQAAEKWLQETKGKTIVGIAVAQSVCGHRVRGIWADGYPYGAVQGATGY